MRSISLLSIFICIQAQAFYQFGKFEVCEDKKCIEVNAGEDLYHAHGFKSDTANYSINFSRNDIQGCIKDSNCWLFLGEVGDSLTIKLNNHIIGKYENFSDFESHKFYLSNDSIKENNTLSILVTDLNQTRFGLRTSNIGIGSKSNVEMRSQKDWLIRTGAPLLSAFTLFVIFLGLVAIFTINRNKKLLPLIALTLVSTLYMLSFSSIPREYIDPIYASGPLHFILRLLVDLMIVVVALTFYKVNSKNKYLKIVPYLYILPIAVMGFGYLTNVHHYDFYKATMLIVAPLVTMGSISLLILSSSYFDKKESMITVPIFALFTFVQIYDLLVFWQIFTGSFTVKLYLPFLILTFAWIFIRRRIHEINTIHLDAAIGEQFKKVSHDLLSPIQRIYSLLNLEHDLSKDSILKKNLNELQLVANSLLQDKEFQSEESKSIRAMLEDLQGKYISTQNIDIQLKLDKVFNWYQPNYEIMLRVFQNLINNSIKGTSTKIIITGYFKDGSIQLDFKDNGKGIPKNLQPYIFDRGTTVSKSNSGLGLNYSKKALNELDATIHLLNTNKDGTSFRIKMPLGEIVLIDDNPIVLDTWATVAKSLNIKFYGLSESNEDINKISMLSNPIVCVDYHLKNNTAVDIIRKLNFKNIKNIYIASNQHLEGYISLGKEFPI